MYLQRDRNGLSHVEIYNEARNKAYNEIHQPENMTNSDKLWESQDFNQYNETKNTMKLLNLKT